MAGEIQYYGDPNFDSGLTLTAQLYDDGGNTVGGAIALTETGTSAIYIGDVPGATGAGTYGVRVFNGASLKAHGELFWDGTAELVTQLQLSSLTADIAAVFADTQAIVPQVNLSVNLLEADEEYTGTKAYKYLKNTTTILTEKDVVGGSLPVGTITFIEA